MTDQAIITVSAANTVSGTLRLGDASVRYRAGVDHSDLAPGDMVAVEIPGRARRLARIRVIQPATETTFDVEAALVAGG